MVQGNVQWVSEGFPVVERASIGASLVGACLTRWTKRATLTQSLAQGLEDPYLDEDCTLLVQQSSTGSVFVQALRTEEHEGRQRTSCQNK